MGEKITHFNSLQTCKLGPRLLRNRLWIMIRTNSWKEMNSANKFCFIYSKEICGH